MIRIKNIDFESEGMKRHTEVYYGDVTATSRKTCFVAPIDCKVDSISVSTKAGQTHNTSQTSTITYNIAGAASSTLGVVTSALSSETRHALTPSSHNSLTAGAMIEFDYSATCQSLTDIYLSVKYTPLKHKNTR